MRNKKTHRTHDLTELEEKILARKLGSLSDFFKEREDRFKEIADEKNEDWQRSRKIQILARRESRYLDARRSLFLG